MALKFLTLYRKQGIVRPVLWLACTVTLYADGNLLASPEEPESRGHTLSYWLERYTTRATDEDRILAKEAEIAIREIGTNAIPALLAWLRYEPSQTKTDILNFLARLRRTSYGRWVPAAFTYDHTVVPRGDIGFLILGPTAAEAIPELERIANDPTHRNPAVRAMMALSAIGPKALPSVEARLSNTNFPLPPEAAVRIYVRTRTMLDEHSISTEMAKPILMELRTNANPVLAKGAAEVLKLLDLPSLLERKRNKSLSEALLDLQTERQMGPSLRPGWNRPQAATRPNRVPVSFTNAATGAVTAWNPHGDEPYPYPLLPGSQAWIDAEPYERIESTRIPKEWWEHATGWQRFRSAIAHPYFSTISVNNIGIAASYQAARNGTVSILREIDTAPDFGTNVLRWLTELDFAKMLSANCSSNDEPCFIEYEIVCYMAGLDSALETLDVASRQRLFKLAVWDADLLAKSDTSVAQAPIGLMYIIYDKPEEFRGAFPSGFILPGATSLLALPWIYTKDADSEKLRMALANAKAAFKLTRRP